MRPKNLTDTHKHAPKQGELTKEILKVVCFGIVIGAATMAAPNTLQLIDYFDPKGSRARKRIWNAIKYLEAKNRLRMYENESGSFVEITAQGKRYLNEEAIWDIAIREPKSWDQKWRLVMFDIPARHQKVRHVFRLKLEDLGFKLYQRSVFIYPHECTTEVLTVAKWYGVEDHVRYIVATEIHDMRRYIKEFDLL